MNRLNFIHDHNARAFIHSFEGGIYLLEIEENGASHWVYEGDGSTPIRFKSFSSARDYARQMGVDNFYLSQDDVYEEMIGLSTPT